MANSNPPKKNQAFTTAITLRDAGDNLSLKTSPTLANGDFKISGDFGTFANVTTLPTNTPSGTVSVKVEFTSAEMNVDTLLLTWIDQTSPKEWADGSITINTTA